jgi:hypothetical protein
MKVKLDHVLLQTTRMSGFKYTPEFLEKKKTYPSPISSALDVAGQAMGELLGYTRVLCCIEQTYRIPPIMFECMLAAHWTPTF